MPVYCPYIMNKTISVLGVLHKYIVKYILNT